MWNKIKILLGFIFIGGIMLAPTDDERIVADAKKYGVFDWIADCYAKGGINEQTAERGTIDVYRRGIKPFDEGKGHYATNNRHNTNSRFYAANNANGVGEDYEVLRGSHKRYLDEADATGQAMPELLRKGLMGLLVVYLGNFAITSMRGEEAEEEKAE